MRTATLILTCVLSFILAGSPSGGAETDTVRQYRLSLLSDPHQPAYHFVVPEGSCMPFDTNGAIFWKGRYHLCYIYLGGNNIGCCWDHASSTDLVNMALFSKGGAVEVGAIEAWDMMPSNPY